MTALDRVDISEPPGQLERLVEVASTIEHRLLHLVREGTQKAIPPGDIVTELGLLAKELGRCYQRSEEIQDRRDIGFRTQARVKDLERHCIWLRRRIQLEQSFFQRWQLETKLRSLISTEAFGVYQEILDSEESTRDFSMREDRDIAWLLRMEGDRRDQSPSP